MAPTHSARQPAGPSPAPAPPASTSTREPPPVRGRRCWVLDEVPGLGAGLAAPARAVARRFAVASVVVLEPGPAPVGEWWGSPLHGPGLLIVHGVIARELHLAGRTATELLGPGDLMRPWDGEDDTVPCDVVWRVLAPTEIAVLDAFFADRIRPWPAIADELMARCVQRAESLARQRAIASHPRVDMRVAMLLWHLAGRWGKVQGDGTVRLDVPLTHRLVGELVGAERPSVSHALGRLQQAGVVAREDDGWHLAGTLEQHAEAALRPLPPRL